AASEAARLIDDVVLPTPPFWIATAMTFPMETSVLRRWSGGRGRTVRAGRAGSRRDAPAWRSGMTPAGRRQNTMASPARIAPSPLTYENYRQVLVPDNRRSAQNPNEPARG